MAEGGAAAPAREQEDVSASSDRPTGNLSLQAGVVDGVRLQLAGIFSRNRPDQIETALAVAGRARRAQNLQMAPAVLLQLAMEELFKATPPPETPPQHRHANNGSVSCPAPQSPPYPAIIKSQIYCNKRGYLCA